MPHKRQACYRQALIGQQHTHLIAIASSKVPRGKQRLLANKAVELGFVETITPVAIRVLLKKLR